MKQRMNFYQVGYNAMKGLFNLGHYLSTASIERQLIELVNFRVSQINGCAYCLDMHSKDLRVMGETEQRLYLLSAWREVNMYTHRERAALGYAEAMTNLTKAGVPDEVYNEARRHFNETEMVDLTIAIVAINSYDRINVAMLIEAGDYQPGQHDMLK